MLRSVCIAASTLLLAVAASAQCSTLTSSGTGAPGTTITLSLDGTAANAIAFLVVGETQGSTPVDLGMLGSFTLGLAAPFTPLPIGVTNASGDVSRGIPVPAGFPGSLDLFAQGVTLSIDVGTGPGLPQIAFAWCVSNVVAFHAGS